ncbi:MAG: hypothetical protein J5644_09410 [Bacteroidales bacterium]|nr:hypothetical protein [Bacteroidales bacterium]
MKRLGLIIVLAVLLGGCHKKGEQDVFQENIQQCAETYVLTELNVNDADSVVVTRIDTLTQMSYAKLMLEMLENLEFQYKQLYDEATLADDDAHLESLSRSLRQISAQTDYFRNIEDNETADNQALLLYWISASYYQKGNKTDFMCFATTDFNLHILDPFADNLMSN